MIFRLLSLTHDIQGGSHMTMLSKPRCFLTRLGPREEDFTCTKVKKEPVLGWFGEHQQLEMASWPQTAGISVFWKRHKIWKKKTPQVVYSSSWRLPKKNTRVKFTSPTVGCFSQDRKNFHTGHLRWKKIHWEDGTRYTSLKLYLEIRTSLVQVHLLVLQVHGQCLGNMNLEKIFASQQMHI